MFQPWEQPSPDRSKTQAKDDYLTKPIDMKAFYAVLRKYLVG